MRSLSGLRLCLAINVIWKTTSEAGLLSPSLISTDFFFYKLSKLSHLDPSDTSTRGLELVPLTSTGTEELNSWYISVLNASVQAIGIGSRVATLQAKTRSAKSEDIRHNGGR